MAFSFPKTVKHSAILEVGGHVEICGDNKKEGSVSVFPAIQVLKSGLSDEND